MEEQAPTEESQPKSGPPIRWIVRGVLATVLIVILVMALMDNKAKTSATDTANAWIEVMENNEELVTVEMLEEKMIGDPEVVIEAVEDSDVEAMGEAHHDYIWKGTFRSYRVRMTTYLDGTLVGRVEGPLND